MKQYGFLEKKKTKFWYLPILKSFIFNFVRIQYEQIMLDKHIDISVSHNHPFNRFGHFWSSIGMIVISYPNMWWGNYGYAVKWFLYTHILRQSGHFFYERQDPDKEKRKFGHKDGTKKWATLGVAMCVLLYVYKNHLDMINMISHDDLAVYFALLTVIPHFAEIWHKFGFLRSIHWAIKITTDPF